MAVFKIENGKLTAYKIQKDIPIPAYTTGPRTTYLPTVDMLQVGESFFLPRQGRLTIQRENKKFCVRKLFEDGQEGFRIWRTE